MKMMIMGEPHSPKSKIMEEDCEEYFVQFPENYGKTDKTPKLLTL